MVETERSQGGSRESDGSSNRPPDDPVWDDWDQPPRIDRMPVLHLAGFDGPMDQLLDLVERGRIDLAGLSAASFADQLGMALSRLAQHMELHRRANLIVLGSRLLQIWSRSAFHDPAQPSSEALGTKPHPAAPLAFSAIQSAADWLEARPQLGRDVFARPRPGRNPRVEGYMALMEACLAVLEGRAGQGEDEPIYRPPARTFLSQAAAARHIEQRLVESPEGGDLLSFVPAVPDAPDRSLRIKAAIAATFTASLELARHGTVVIDQLEGAACITLRSCSSVAAHHASQDATARASAP